MTDLVLFPHCDLVLFPHCDMHLSINTTGTLPFRVFRRTLPVGTDTYTLTDVTGACSYQLFAPYNTPADPAHDRLETFVTIDPAARTITPDAPGINLLLIQNGQRYIVARIQVHNDILGWWFGNASITTALDANVAHSQPSIYAIFSDDASKTDLVGDITGHGYVTLTSSSNGTFTVANTNNEGRLQGRAEGAADLNGSFLGVNQSIPVQVIDYAKNRQNLVTVRASDLSNASAKHNILFLAEGFLAADQDRFDGYVTKVTDELFSKPRHEPFNLVEGQFNVFKAFQGSKDNLVSCGFQVTDESVDALGKGLPIPYSRRVSTGAAKYTVEELVARVGLPLRDENRNEAQLKALWASQSLHDYDQALVDGRLVAAWKNSRSLGFLEARDTFFGLILGRRWADRVSGGGAALAMPAADAAGDANLAPFIERVYEWFNPRGANRSLTPDPRRHPPEYFEGGRESRGISIMAYMNGLQLAAVPHAQIGSAWVPDGTFKPSRGLVAMIVNDGLIGGTNFNDGTITANTLASASALQFEYPASNTATKKVMRRKPPNKIPENIDDIINTVAHEFGHSFNLGDEYEERRGDNPDAFDGYDNIASLSSIFHDFASREIEPGKVKWFDLLRIKMSSVLTQDSQTSGGSIQVTIDPREIPRWTDAKTQGLEAYLRRPRIEPDGRQLPLAFGDPDSLVRLVLGDINANNGTINLGGPELPPQPFSVFPAGSLLFIPKEDESGQLMFVVEEKVRDLINNDHRPLNKDPDVAKVNNDPDHPRDIPDFKPPCKSARLVGVFEGASSGTGLVYRPTGTCKMRTNGGSGADGEFCHVCKWLIVNRIDPGKHEILDRNFYPEAKKNG